MNRALVIHFLGFYAVNSLMPGWAVSADADILAFWYASFAMIDLIALMVMPYGEGARAWMVSAGLQFSMLWSAFLCVEMMMFGDLFQAADPDMQRYLDILLGGMLIIGVIQEAARQRSARGTVSG